APRDDGPPVRVRRDEAAGCARERRRLGAPSQSEADALSRRGRSIRGGPDEARAIPPLLDPDAALPAAAGLARLPAPRQDASPAVPRGHLGSPVALRGRRRRERPGADRQPRVDPRPVPSQHGAGGRAPRLEAGGGSDAPGAGAGPNLWRTLAFCPEG